MIKIAFFVIWGILFCLLPNALQAQFVNLRLKIEPELTTTVEQDLTFGTLISNSGRTEIQLGDLNVGVFSIRAYHTQNVYMNLQFPSTLKSISNAITDEIPIDLRINYNNSGVNAPLNSKELVDNQGYISIHEQTNLIKTNDIWKQMFIYVYGAINIGNVPNGIYTAEVILSIDYD